MWIPPYTPTGEELKALIGMGIAMLVILICVFRR